MGKRMAILKFSLLTFVSFIAGFAAYLIELSLSWNEPVGGDLVVVFYSGIAAYLFLAVPLYVLLFRGLEYLCNKILKLGRPPASLYLMLPALLCFIPTYLISLRYGGGGALTALAQPESMLFNVFFATSGAVFGFGWTFLKNGKYSGNAFRTLSHVLLGVFILIGFYLVGSKGFQEDVREPDVIPFIWKDNPRFSLIYDEGYRKLPGTKDLSQIHQFLKSELEKINFHGTIKQLYYPIGAKKHALILIIKRPIETETQLAWPAEQDAIYIQGNNENEWIRLPQNARVIKERTILLKPNRESSAGSYTILYTSDYQKNRGQMYLLLAGSDFDR